MKKKRGDRVKHIFKRVLAFWIMFNTTNLRIFPIGEGDAATPVTMKAQPRVESVQAYTMARLVENPDVIIVAIIPATTVRQTMTSMCHPQNLTSVTMERYITGRRRKRRKIGDMIVMTVNYINQNLKFCKNPFLPDIAKYFEHYYCRYILTFHRLVNLYMIMDNDAVHSQNSHKLGLRI